MWNDTLPVCENMAGSPWLIYVSASLVPQSVGNLRWLLTGPRALQWVTGKVADRQRSLCPGAPGI